MGQRATFRDLLVFGRQGRSTTNFGFPTSACGTSWLDMVGDLALAGATCGRFVAYRSGHRLNAELVRAIVAERGTQHVLESATFIQTASIALTER